MIKKFIENVKKNCLKLNIKNLKLSFKFILFLKFKKKWIYKKNKNGPTIL
jgi:hypothetical protein